MKLKQRGKSNLKDTWQQEREESYLYSSPQRQNPWQPDILLLSEVPTCMKQLTGSERCSTVIEPAVLCEPTIVTTRLHNFRERKIWSIKFSKIEVMLFLNFGSFPCLRKKEKSLWYCILLLSIQICIKWTVIKAHQRLRTTINWVCRCTDIVGYDRFTSCEAHRVTHLRTIKQS